MIRRRGDATWASADADVPALIDTGVLYALVDERDPAHSASRDAIRREREAIVAPQVLLCEVCYLLRSRFGGQAEAAFVASLRGSEWGLEPITSADLPRIAELVQRYAEAGVGFVDAAIVTMAERLGVRRIYTLDRRHFSLVRPRHVEAFELLP